MSVREIIVETFSEVVREQNRPVVALTDDALLLNLGLDSLSMAIIVARLEGSLGTDPFSEADEAEMPATFGEFVARYENVPA